MAIIVTGTDTGIGKTVISTWLCVNLGASYHKPVQTGEVHDSDFAAAHPGVHVYSSVCCFSKPLSPHLAAKYENKIIREIVLPDDPNVIVEGVGGVMVPLNEDKLLVDYMKEWNVPVIIVASDRIGTINHTCLTLEVLRARGLKVIGVIMNGLNQENANSIKYYGDTKIIYKFPRLRDASNLKAISMPSSLRESLQQFLCNTVQS